MIVSLKHMRITEVMMKKIKKKGSSEILLAAGL